MSPTACSTRNRSPPGASPSARRDQHLGTLGRLDPRPRLPGPRHELLCPLLLRRRSTSGSSKTSAASATASAPGYRQIVIDPQIDPKLHWAKTSYRSARGRIATSWTLEGEKLSLDVTIPPGTMATVYVPTKDGRILESGKPIDTVEGATLMRTTGDRAQVSIVSGTYKFSSTIAVMQKN